MTISKLDVIGKTENMMQLIFSVNQNRYSIDIEKVETIIRAAFITPLPDSPDYVLGVLNIKGEFIPVIDLSSLFEKKPSQIKPSQFFILTRCKDSRVALLGDKIDSLHNVSTAQKISLEQVASHNPYLTSVFNQNNCNVYEIDLSSLNLQPALSQKGFKIQAA